MPDFVDAIVVLDDKDQILHAHIHLDFNNQTTSNSLVIAVLHYHNHLYSFDCEYFAFSCDTLKCSGLSLLKFQLFVWRAFSDHQLLDN